MCTYVTPALARAMDRQIAILTKSWRQLVPLPTAAAAIELIRLAPRTSYNNCAAAAGSWQ